MGHEKSRSSVSIGAVDWSDPLLSSLLEKADSWRLENRSNLPPQEVRIHINTDWVKASTISKPALMVARNETTMVLVTRFPVPLGERLRVDSQQDDGAAHMGWGQVVEVREGYRAEDHEHGLFLNWLRID
ncbi:MULTISPECIES: hypothetical protein [Rhodanobacter]|uniref:Uncharacterized protein n=1 Tax=Rhodanobacter hydrolyticus TaxID=2250595 RepID=A0ABW8JDX1_9GAMM|nr:hypothetical protein [Rhodanobacter sp. 7MK24]MBD8880231.1 hypothetical protein [Rhodanobacter sp. 7MK24]